MLIRKDFSKALKEQVHRYGKTLSRPTTTALFWQARKDGGGGAWGLFNNGAAIDSYFDMQNVSYATCDISASEDVKEFYITIATDDSSKYSANPLTAGKHHEIKIPCNLTKRYVNPLLTMGGVCNEGATIVPSNFTFYDKDGKEIVPKIVDKKDIEDKKEIFDENVTTEGLEWTPTGIMTWAENGPDKVSIKLENMGFTGLTAGCNDAGGWAGFGIGMISSDGSKTEKYIDVTKVKSVEFDVYSRQDGEFKFVIQSGKETKDEFMVKTQAFETVHMKLETTDGKHKNWTNFLYMFDSITGYSADTPIVITNLVFKDKDGNAITNFTTRLNTGEDVFNTPVTDLGDF